MLSPPPPIKIFCPDDAAGVKLLIVVVLVLLCNSKDPENITPPDTCKDAEGYITPMPTLGLNIVLVIAVLPKVTLLDP